MPAQEVQIHFYQLQKEVNYGAAARGHNDPGPGPAPGRIKNLAVLKKAAFSSVDELVLLAQ